MQDKSKGPYKGCLTSKDHPPYLYGVEGPGSGLGFYAWAGYPQNTFKTMKEAEKTARMMNIAFAEGERARGRKIKELLE